MTALFNYMYESPRSQRALFHRALSSPLQAELLAELTPKDQYKWFQELTCQEMEQLLESLSPDDRTELLTELPAPLTERALNLLDSEEQDMARRLMGYPDETVGRIMTPDYVEVRPDWTVKKAMEHIRSLGDLPETIISIFVTDKRGRLLDDISLRRLVNADEDKKITDLMDYVYVSIEAQQDQEVAVRAMKKFDLRNLPVTDPDNKLLGLVTIDDVMDIATEEASEDFQRFGGSEPLDRPYFDLSIFQIAWKRVGWLLFLFFGGTLTSSVIGAYESELNETIILSFFIPLLIGTGGNAGAQSVSTIIRALAVGEVQWEHIFKVIFREFLAGLVMGSVLGVIGFGFVMFAWGAPANVSFVVALTLPAICTWANVVAGAIPIIADQFGIDPTVISAPLITTVVDATGLVIYFSLALWMLGL
jgi:magnesium transporter